MTELKGNKEGGGHMAGNGFLGFGEAREGGRGTLWAAARERKKENEWVLGLFLPSLPPW